MSATTAATQWVYDFAEGSRDMRDLLGGKGANVAEMTRVLGAERVPAGFTITTDACVAYMQAGRRAPDGLDAQVAEALGRLEEQAGRGLGDPSDPLLVSVRSGARESMPGMLDTVLNLGLNDESVAGLAERTGNERFAWDSYRRFVQMYGNVVLDVEGERFEAAIKAAKQARGVTLDTELDGDALRELVADVPGLLRVPHRAPGPAARGHHGRLRLLAGRPRRRLPAHQPDPRRVGHRGQRAADGVRQQGRHVRLRRRLQPRRGHGRARAVRRLPDQRPGGGRRLGRPQHPGHRRARRAHARGARRAPGHPAHARAPLRRHAGHRVHRRGGASVHAADAQRQAARAGGGALRGRRGRRGPAGQGEGDRHGRRREPRRAAAPDVRPAGRLRGAGARRRGVARRGQGRGRLHRGRCGQGRRGRS